MRETPRFAAQRQSEWGRITPQEGPIRQRCDVMWRPSVNTVKAEALAPPRSPFRRGGMHKRRVPYAAMPHGLGPYHTG